MRTKFYLGALCLPLAFAACTNEEFESQITPSLGNRGSIDVVLTAEKPAIGADTKMSIDENNRFLWEKGTDMIGAAMVDGASKGTVGDEVFVNYPFTADNDGNVSTFTGKSSMTQGLYFFYYAYNDVLDRKGLPLNMSEQVYDPSSEKTPIQQASTYMKMISPIVDLTEEGVKYADVDKYNLNLEFANLYTMVKVNIAAENIPTGVTPSVTKVTLNGKDGSNNEFVNKATAKFTASEGIADAGTLELTEEGTLDAEKQAAALEILEELIANGKIYNVSSRGASVLTVKDGCTLSADKETSLYILAPKGTYKELTLTVETSEGSYNRTIDFSTKNAVLGNDIPQIAADLNFAQDGTGNVQLTTTFDIASAEDWKNAVDFMTAHAIGYLNKEVTFNLTKDIAIDNLPVFDLTITGTNTLTLNKDYTINANNASQFTATGITLGVAQGATLTVAAEPSFKAIKNNGTLNVTANTISKAITNLGMMNVNADASFTGGVTNGQKENKMAVPAVPEISGTINIAKGKTAVIGTTALTNNVGNIEIAADAILKIKVADSKNEEKGTITINGKLQKDESGSITNNGTIDNYGTLACPVTNNATIIVEKNSICEKSNARISGSGIVKVIDVTTFSKLQTSLDSADQQYDIENTNTVTTEVNSAAEYKAADESEKITNIILNGGEWTLAVAYGADASKTIKSPEHATSLTLKAATFKGNSQTLANKGIIVEGASSIVGLATISGCSLTVAEGASMNVGNGVTMNGTSSADYTSFTATINGSLTVEAGAKTYFEEATVGEDGHLIVKGQTDSAAAAEFGVKSTFTNSGIVESQAATKQDGTGEAGKVSQPDNQAGSTFKGKASTFSWS